MKLSAAELVIAKRVAFIESEDNYPYKVRIIDKLTTFFFLIISIEGLIKFFVTKDIPMKEYIIPKYVIG